MEAMRRDDLFRLVRLRVSFWIRTFIVLPSASPADADSSVVETVQ